MQKGRGGNHHEILQRRQRVCRRREDPRGNRPRVVARRNVRTCMYRENNRTIRFVPTTRVSRVFSSHKIPHANAKPAAPKSSAIISLLRICSNDRYSASLMVLEHVCDSGSDSGPRWRASVRRNSQPANPVGPSAEAPVQNCSSARRRSAQSRSTHRQNQPTMAGSPPGRSHVSVSHEAGDALHRGARGPRAKVRAAAARHARGAAGRRRHQPTQIASGEKARSERGGDVVKTSRINRTALRGRAPHRRRR